MSGRIESGQLCTVVPVDPSMLRVGDHDYLHLISEIDGSRFQISNNRGFINGWVDADALFGRCVRIEP